MDSASPIANRTAGQTSPDAGVTFIRAMKTNKAEFAFAFDWLGCPLGGRRRGGARHRDAHRPSARGYGHAA